MNPINAPILTFASSALLVACLAGGPPAHAAGVTQTVAVRETMIIAFLPPAAQRSSDPGLSNAASHLTFAVTDATTCLKPKRVGVRTLYVDRIVLHNGTHQETFDVSDMAHGIGAILVEPSREARVVIAEIGPSALQHMLPRAASEYWHVSSCRQGA